MGHRRAVRLFLRASTHRFERVAKGQPVGLKSASFAIYALCAWNLRCANDGTEFCNFIFKMMTQLLIDNFHKTFQKDRF